MRVVVRGTVQGVGFRPFVYRLAREMSLCGWVNNGPHGVTIEVEGLGDKLEEFLLRLGREKPPVSTITGIEHAYLDSAGFSRFDIVESVASDDVVVPVLPDIATCPRCIEEVFDPRNRRHRYPFTNCTHCGPRFSIVEGLPYDRPNTTMRRFEMCPDCQREYDDPADRRFHAQPNACPSCGPRLEWWGDTGSVLAMGEEALQLAVEAVRGGRIVAVKGLGGFHLIVNAGDDGAVRRLRERKHRDEKPFAIMVPSLEYARTHCDVSEIEAHLLSSPEAPIVLLRRTRTAPVGPSVAPGNPYLGVMLAYTPLHHLLMTELGCAVVATSGNLAEEPICTDEKEALDRLGGIADAFLVHDRPIARHVDDSVVRVVAGRVLVNRRARGYAPLPVTLITRRRTERALAVGGHLKNAIAVSKGDQAFLSQHIGDMSSTASLEAFEKIIADFESLYHLEPERVVCDMHPDYVTSKRAEALAGHAPVEKVQHHFAHVASCMAENEIEEPVLGVSWDGTGYGTDGTVWGGEFMRVEDGQFERIAHLRTFRLPGGEEAVREPRRSAVGLLYELFGYDALTWERFAPVRAFTDTEMTLVARMLQRNVNAPRTSSVGRLFDAVASIVGLRQKNNFEGQAAMELEFNTHGVLVADRYQLDILEPATGPAVVDWRALIHAIMEDVEHKVPTGVISTKFHNTLAEVVLQVARYAGEERVVLTGGCFQNRYLTEKTIARLDAYGFWPYWHQRVPPNDGGIALGQLAVVAARGKGDERNVSGDSG